MKLDLDYKQPTDSKTSSVSLSVDYIEFAVQNKYPDGLDGQKRRIYGRIQRKLDEAVATGKDELELEEAEKDFIRVAVRDCKAPSQIAKYFVVLEDEVERATKAN